MLKCKIVGEITYTLVFSTLSQGDTAGCSTAPTTVPPLDIIEKDWPILPKMYNDAYVYVLGTFFGS